MVERVYLCVGALGLRTAEKVRVPGNLPRMCSDCHTHKMSSVWLVEQYVKHRLLNCSETFCHFPITSHVRKSTQPIPTASSRKLGRSLGTKLYTCTCICGSPG